MIYLFLIVYCTKSIGKKYSVHNPIAPTQDATWAKLQAMATGVAVV